MKTIGIPFEVNQALITAQRRAGASFAFDVISASLRDEAELDSMARDVVGYFLSPANEIDLESMDVFRSTTSGNCIIGLILCYGGPSVSAEYDSRTGCVTIDFSWGGDFLVVRSSDASLGIVNFFNEIAGC